MQGSTKHLTISIKLSFCLERSAFEVEGEEYFKGEINTLAKYGVNHFTFVKIS